MNNLQKRVLTSLILLPLSFFFILKGGYFLLFYLFLVFTIANYELFTVFKKKSIILFIDLTLFSSLFSIYYLADFTEVKFYLLLWAIILVICSDIGGYVFGKTFKGKKLTKISPKKTISGVLGSFIFSVLSIFIMEVINYINLYHLSILPKSTLNLYDIKYLFLAIIFSLIAQAGDLTISYFKRIEKIKDTGKVLPGHGGILDRIDGLMFVVIVMFIFYKIQIIP